jgi:hypothetical protein
MSATIAVFWTLPTILILVAAAAGVVLAAPALRRPVVTRHLLGQFRLVLPAMSRTAGPMPASAASSGGLSETSRGWRRRSRIAGRTYQMDAARRVFLAALEAGERPAVLSAVLKYHLTERYRQVINDAMDIQGAAASAWVRPT